MQVGELAGIAVGATVMLNILIAGYVTVSLLGTHGLPKKQQNKFTKYTYHVSTITP